MQSASPVVLVSKTVLLVDDQGPGALEADALRAVGAFVLGPIAKDGEAFELIDRAAGIDVAIVDIDAAAPDVAALVQHLSQQGIPTVLVSARGEMAAEAVCSASAVSGKPIDLGMVAAALWLGPKSALR